MSLYEALTLNLPYAADTDEAYISAVAMKQPIPARGRSRAVPRDLETVLMKCMERDPERRYGSAAELKDELQRFLRDEPVLARRPGTVIKLARSARRHRAALVAAILSPVLLFSMAVALIWWQRLRREDEQIRRTLEQSIAARSHVGTFVIKEEYPEYFPRKVFQIQGKPIDSYFRPSRVRILRLNMPQNPSSGIRFIWPGEDKESYCVARDEILLDRPFGIELFGTINNQQLPVPLAADAGLFDDGVAEPLFSFPLALGAEKLYSGNALNILGTRPGLLPYGGPRPLRSTRIATRNGPDCFSPGAATSFTDATNDRTAIVSLLVISL